MNRYEENFTCYIIFTQFLFNSSITVLRLAYSLRSSNSIPPPPINRAKLSDTIFLTLQSKRYESLTKQKNDHLLPLTGSCELKKHDTCRGGAIRNRTLFTFSGKEINYTSSKKRQTVVWWQPHPEIRFETPTLIVFFSNTSCLYWKMEKLFDYIFSE